MQTLIAAVNALTALFNTTFGRVLLDGFGNLSTAIPSVVLQGSTATNATSVAYEASRQAKATPGVLVGLSGYNSKSTAQFILLIDSASATVPAAGTVPALIIAVPGLSNFSYDPGAFGRRFSAGIWVANSSTGPTLTIGSADCWFDAQVN